MKPRPKALVAAARGRPGQDPIFALDQEATRRSASGESILNATIGTLSTEDGRLAVMPSVLETLQRVQDDQVAGYTPVAGRPDFLAAVIDDLFGDGPLAAQAVAAATPGGTGAIYQSVVNFLEPGQALLTPSYHWGPYRVIADHSGRDVQTFEMFGADERFDTDALAAALEEQVSGQGRALVVLNDPCHNPTGYSLSPDEWRRVSEVLCAVGERAPVAVLLDLAYFLFGGASARAWTQAVPDLLESTTVLVAWTASKSFTQYGARVGALVALHADADERNEIQNALGFSCRGTWSNSNHLGQRAVTELLTVPELRARTNTERAELIALLDERIEAFNGGARQIGLRTPRYEAGFFVTVFTRHSRRAATAMRDIGVYVLPIPGALRIALCSTPRSQIPRLLDALEKGVVAGA